MIERLLSSVFNNKVYLLLLLIVLLGGILRFYKISEVPVSLYWDEVSSAYNAYSISSTGKDEFGNSFPLLFKAFDDYKTPVNIYLTAVSVKVFGLNEFSARLSSAFLGTLTVLVCFFLIKELLNKRYLNVDSATIGLITAFLLTISPWHIQFSRISSEANVGLFFVVLGSFLFFKFINSEHYKYFFSSMLIFAISVYAYRSIWVFVPLFMLSLFYIYKAELFRKGNLKKTALGLFLFLIILLPFIPEMISREGTTRANQTGIIQNSDKMVYEFAKKQENTGALGKIIYNRRVAYGIEFIGGYLSHFSPHFLFFEGDENKRHGVTGVGVLYFWSIFFIIPGLLFLLKLEKKTKLVIISWLLIAPIAAAVSVPTPHALRSLNMLPMPYLIISLGLLLIYVKMKGKIKIIYSAFVIVVILYFSIQYLNLYYGRHAIISSSDWGDGYKQLTEFVFENENEYDKIIVSGHYWQPYIYFLFYKKYDSESFQKFGSVKGFDKYIFGGTSWDHGGKELGDLDLEELAKGSSALVALSPLEYNLQKENLDIIKEIRNHNNELVFYVGKLK